MNLKKLSPILIFLILFSFGFFKNCQLYSDSSNPCSENYIPGQYDPAMVEKLGPPPSGESFICDRFGDPRDENLLFKIGSVNFYDKNRDKAQDGKAICVDMLEILSRPNTYAGLAEYALKKVGGINYIVFSDEVAMISANKNPISEKDRWFFRYFFEKQKQVAELFIE